jgi:hypothetical protein
MTAHERDRVRKALKRTLDESVVAIDDVTAALTVPAVLDTYGVTYRDAPQIRLTTCPRCGARTKRAAVAINRASGEWCHQGGTDKCRGDLLEFVAAYAGLD